MISPEPGARPRQTKFVLVLLLVGLALHFFRLGQPPAVIFDEVHFGSFADAYCCSGEYFFDVHPPHGKLLAASGLKLSGYPGGQSFETIGTALEELDARQLRVVPALVGSLIPILVFLILSQLGASSWAAFLGGWAALFDNALLLQTRVLALEGLLILAMLAAISLALAAISQRGRLRPAVLCLGAGLCIGIAVGTKFTGLTSAALVAFILLVPQRSDYHFGRSLGLGICALVGAVIAYLGGWVLHFHLLDQPGPGDIWGSPSGNMIQDIIDIHRSMFQANYGLTATHPNGSPWWGWPWMWRPIYYYAGEGAAIYLVGNPVVWWGSSVGLLLVLWGAVRRLIGAGSAGEPIPSSPIVPTPMPAIRLLPLLGFLVSFLPYLLIPRVMFLYHYLPSLMFAIMAVALWLDQFGWTRLGRFTEQPGAFRWLVILIPTGFLLLSPLTYGLPLPDWLLGAVSRLVH